MATPIEEKIDQNLKVSLTDLLDRLSHISDFLPNLMSPDVNVFNLGCIFAGSHGNGHDK